MGRSYSTQDIRAQDITAQDRFDYWKDVVESTYASSSTNKQLNEGEFAGELSVKSLGSSALITRIQSTPIEYQETILGQRTEDYFICLSLCPRALLSQNGLSSVQLEKDIVVYDNNLPFCYAFPEGDNQIVISVPHAVLSQHFPEVQSYLNQTLHRKTPLSTLLVTMIQSTWETEELEDVFGDRVLITLLHLLRTAFEANEPSSIQAVQQYKFDKLALAKEFILANLVDSELNVEKISQQLHISARTLSRLFARENTTVMRWLWQQRLNACHRALLMKTNLPISKIAYDYGFSNLSHFNKLFKEEYGITPSDLRQQ
ncbi:transcriptional regulator, AraC family [Acinetobacter marinus]|uniref:Transcriptional regulator, AraC family n=1 Tax=Acinetobacter marinus TaxID=281375 RepID=A0A1G6LI56_9GAMM|nr:AraC family transcriptional regulator [Acinetobacter marinus]SDC42647.1 transcriptional regulator, AraC family [Acinetobacter marinus]